MIQEQPEVISYYVPYLSFNKKASDVINNKFITPKIDRFFVARRIAKGKYKPIDVTKYISDLDFKTVSFSYFYENILADITKKQSGEILHTVKYGITFDEEVTHKICEETKTKYDEILLNKKPIFYFIYFDLKEIIIFLREEKMVVFLK